MKGKEFFNKKKKIIVAAIILILLVVISIPISVHFYNLHNYNKYLELGQANLNKEKFDEAANDYKSALKYQSKNKEVINQKLSLVKLLKESKQKYDQAILLFNDKKYLDAINDFNDISKDDKNYYKKAQDKITECKTSYINDNISKAKTDADSKNYSEAITFLDTVLKFDSTCKEASSLKEQYNNEIQKIKDEEAAAKKKAEEEAAAKKAEEEAAAAAKKAAEEAAAAAKKAQEEAANKKEQEEEKLRRLLLTPPPQLPQHNFGSY